MTLTPAQLLALKSELNTDPTGLGYAGKSDGECADILNLPRAGVTIRRTNIAPQEILEAVDNRDFDPTAIPAHNSWFESVTQLQSIRLVNDDGSNTRVLGNLRRMLLTADPQGSRARLDAIANRLGSRAEQLFGRDVVPTHIDVAMARLA